MEKIKIWVLRIVAVVFVLVLFIGSVMPYIEMKERDVEYEKEFNVILKENREAVYGFNKLVNEVRADGVLKDDVREGMLGYLESIDAKDLEYLKKDKNFFEVVEYVLTTDDRVVDEKYVSDTFDVEWLIDSGDLVEDVTLNVFESYWSDLAKTADKGTDPFGMSETERTLSVSFILFGFMIAGFGSLFLFAMFKDDDGEEIKEEIKDVSGGNVG